MKFPLHLREKYGSKGYNSLNRVLRESFHARVHKVSLRLDFTCPNQDGRVAVEGKLHPDGSILRTPEIDRNLREGKAP
ncbi:MAG: hypothetical protein O7B35_08990 [Deltaproteobacteria bacterium]|nr:hypothetical protein [Deltaproteobacteria bacterium]